jgi:uncharacterized damage-inducible protein DinB
MDILKQQYELVLGSRGAMLDFIERAIGQGLITPIKEFNGSNIRYLLVHTAETYKHWCANFPLQLALPYVNEDDIVNIPAIRKLYSEADNMVANLLQKYGGNLVVPITSKTRRGLELTLTPLQLFTHVITHEYHHKGQIMTMCRLLGHIPPDTDAIRF